MSGFSPAWLDLREPFDLAARDRQVMAACADRFRSYDRITVVDLGAGTGASIRAFADLLPPQQSWLLIDHDGTNLAAAADRLAAWADTATQRGDVLKLKRGPRLIEVKTRCGDLAGDLEALCPPADLITLSALLDLTSGDWIRRLANHAVGRHSSVLATLTFDGRIACAPAQSLDHEVARAFAAHQRREKGFGVAAGPDANDLAVRTFADRGYQITSGDSPWTVASAGPFQEALVDGIAAAVTEMGAPGSAEIADWSAEARDGARQLVIGHRDLFARP